MKRTSQARLPVSWGTVNKETSPQFIQSFLSSYEGQKTILRTQVGGGREGLNFQGVRSIKLFIPQFEEQQKIANFLSAIGRKIELVGTELEHAQTFKKGLLQQMFV